MKKIRRIYVAGPLTATGRLSNSALEYLDNARILIQAAKDVLLAGLSPFCPALDFMYFLSTDGGERITLPMIQRMSKDWLVASDAILVAPGWRKSKGTLVEVAVANRLNIPVFESLEEILDANNGGKG